MDSERARSDEFGDSEPEGTGYPAHRSRRDSSTHETSLPGPVEARVDDALERVAHGATVSISAILLNQGLGFGFTVVLTNGFGAASYGFFVQSLVVVVVGVLLATGVGGGSLPSRG